MRIRSVFAGVLVAGLVAVAGGPAAAGVSNDLLMKGAKKSSGPYSDGVQFPNFETGQTKNVYLKVKSLTGAKEDGDLLPFLHPAGLKVKFFTKDGTNITSQ